MILWLRILAQTGSAKATDKNRSLEVHWTGDEAPGGGQNVMKLVLIGIEGICACHRHSYWS